MADWITLATECRVFDHDFAHYTETDSEHVVKAECTDCELTIPLQ